MDDLPSSQSFSSADAYVILQTIGQRTNFCILLCRVSIKKVEISPVIAVESFRKTKCQTLHFFKVMGSIFAVSVYELIKWYSIQTFSSSNIHNQIIFLDFLKWCSLPGCDSWQSENGSRFFQPFIQFSYSTPLKTDPFPPFPLIIYSVNDEIWLNSKGSIVWGC